MGTPGPIGFEPGMFKKELEEHKPKNDTSNKVKTFHIIKISLCKTTLIL